MKILFLDDNPNRQDIAREHFALHIFFEASTVEEAVKLLELHSPYDLVHLDHDLGGEIFAPSDEQSGYWVAKHISMMEKHLLPKQVVIHSLNDTGAQNIINVLKELVPVSHEPFNFSD